MSHAMRSDPDRIVATVETIRTHTVVLLNQSGEVAIIARYPVLPEEVLDILSWWPNWGHSCCNTSLPLPGYGADFFQGPVHVLVELVSKLLDLAVDLDVPSIEEQMLFQFWNIALHASRSDSPAFFSSEAASGSLDGQVTVSISMPNINIEWRGFPAVPRDGRPRPSIVNLLLIAGIWRGLAVAGPPYFPVQWLVFKLRQAEWRNSVTRSMRKHGRPSKGWWHPWCSSVPNPF